MVRGALSTSFFALLFCLSAEIGISTPPVSKEVENKINKVTKKKGSLSNLFPIKSAKSTSRGNPRLGRAHLTDGHDEYEPAYWTTGEETCVNSDVCPTGIGLDDIFSPNEWEDCNSIAHLNLRQVHGVELTGAWGILDEATHMAHIVVKLDYHDIQEPENVFLVGKWFCKRCMKEESIPQKFRIGQGEFPLYHFEYHPGQSEGYYQLSKYLGEDLFNLALEGFFDGFRIKVKRGKQDMRLCKYFVWGYEYSGECSEHGLDYRYTRDNCPGGCECCMENGSCGECQGDHVCRHGDGYNYCQPCDSMSDIEEEISQCLSGAGGGFEHHGDWYDNTCWWELTSNE